MSETDQIKANKLADTSPLEYLVRHLLLAKKQEDAAKFHRITLEEKIATHIPGPERGFNTVTLPNGTKVTVERGFNYKADAAAIEAEFNQAMKPAPIKTKTTRELDIVGYEWYLTNDPEGAALLAGKVTVAPKKVSIAIKEKK